MRPEDQAMALARRNRQHREVGNHQSRWQARRLEQAKGRLMAKRGS